jgi:hypothetical protein
MQTHFAFIAVFLVLERWSRERAQPLPRRPNPVC